MLIGILIGAAFQYYSMSSCWYNFEHFDFRLAFLMF